MKESLKSGLEHELRFVVPEPKTVPAVEISRGGSVRHEPSIAILRFLRAISEAPVGAIRVPLPKDGYGHRGVRCYPRRTP